MTDESKNNGSPSPDNDRVNPEAARPESPQPDASLSESPQPESSQPESSQPESPQPESPPRPSLPDAETPSAPAASTPAAPDPGPAADQRPRPAYGEYAPEVWSWTPPGTEEGTLNPQPTDLGTDAGAGTAASGVAGQRNAAPGPTNHARSGQIPGVPHNLGARGATPGLGAGRPTSAPTSASTSTSTPVSAPTSSARPPAGQPAAGQPPTGQPAAGQPQSSPSAPPQYGQVSGQQGGQQSGQQGGQQHYRAAAPPVAAERSASKNRLADRIISIVLLVLGALGVLYSAAYLYSLPAILSQMGSALAIDDFTVPGSVGTAGMVGALVLLAVYALNLIFTLQRIRARKLAFWVPLVAGAISGIVWMGFIVFATAQAPELMQQMADPDAMGRVLEYYSTP